MAGFKGSDLQIAKSKMVFELIPMGSLNSNQETLFNLFQSLQILSVYGGFSGRKLAGVP